MELWDVYDINRNKTGKVIDRHSNDRLRISFSNRSYNNKFKK